MADQVVFDFAVPDELLKEVVAKSRTPEAVADLASMPGTGEGKPPPLVARLLVAVEREPQRRYRDTELAELGIDASTLYRKRKQYNL